jgi:hypothetical protein
MGLGEKLDVALGLTEAGPERKVHTKKEKADIPEFEWHQVKCKACGAEYEVGRKPGVPPPETCNKCKKPLG